MKLEWKESARGRLECRVTEDFMIAAERVSPRDSPETKYAAAVFSGTQMGYHCRYRSSRLLGIEEAKALAISQGTRVARLISKSHASIADFLKGVER